MSPQDKGIPTSPVGTKPIQTGTPEEDRSLQFGTSRELQETKGIPPMALPSFFLKRNTCFRREKSIQEFSPQLPVPWGCQKSLPSQAVQDRLEAGLRARSVSLSLLLYPK